MKHLPIACSLTPEALDRRRSAFGDLAARIVERSVTPERFLAKFNPAPSLLRSLAAFVDLERECCRFLRFEITAEEDDGPIWLRVEGPAGTGTFIEGMIPQS